MTNVIVNAINKAKQHIDNAVTGPDQREIRRKELEKLNKTQLIDMVLGQERFDSVKIEDLARPILEDPDCAWLDYETIAGLIVQAVPSAKTTSKSLASYASKYPSKKGWDVVQRKSNADRQRALMSLASID